MIDARGPQEARLLAVERGAESLGRQLRALDRRTLALSQGVWAAWSDVEISTPTPTPTTCTASYTGTLTDACGNVLSGVTVTIKNHATSATLDTQTTNGSGVFSGSITITAPSLVVDIVTTSPASTTTQTWMCGANTVGPISIGSGVATITSSCGAFCAQSTQTLTDSLYGAVTLAWNGTAWVGTNSAASIPAHAPCGAATIGITYTLSTSAQVIVAWHTSTVVPFGCPTATGTPFSMTLSTTPSSCTPTPTLVATNNGGGTQQSDLRAGAALQTFTCTLA